MSIEEIQETVEVASVEDETVQAPVAASEPAAEPSVQEAEEPSVEVSEEPSEASPEAQDSVAPDAGPRQGEMPFAMVEGKAFTDLPSDLYIPPDALEVILEAFEGPLDLLLYLIRRQNLDILEINVAEITRQYMGYVEMMSSMRFELAAEYLVMAAMLAEIKSRMLLPRPPEAEEEEGEDPRAALIRRLQEYERFKTAAEDIDELPRVGRDIHQASASGPDRKLTRPEPEVDLKEVLVALADVLRRADMFESHQVEKEKLSTRERMTQVLDSIKHRQFVPFVNLFRVEEGRLGVVVTFLAVMELVKESLVELVQNESFGPIHVRARGEVADGSEPEVDETGTEYGAGTGADTEDALDTEIPAENRGETKDGRYSYEFSFASEADAREFASQAAEPVDTPVAGDDVEPEQESSSTARVRPISLFSEE
ncbi:segregation/condensation protein A [Microbulbifer agarilyticus]|nr:segregation/condensation protein A [Microbulbifer agarilyticus]